MIDELKARRDLKSKEKIAKMVSLDGTLRLSITCPICDGQNKPSTLTVLLAEYAPAPYVNGKHEEYSILRKLRLAKSNVIAAFQRHMEESH